MSRPRTAVLCTAPLLTFVLLAASPSDALAFERFVYRQSGALGFCPPVGAVFAAEVLREAPDRYVATLSVLDLVPEGAAGGECLRVTLGAPRGTCARERTFAPRVLEPAEVESLESRLDEVISRLEPDVNSNCGLLDTCLVRTLQLDGVHAAHGACSELSLTGEALVSLFRAVEELRPAFAAVENGDTNGDGVRDLSDAAHLLQHLFLGGPRPVEARCRVDFSCPAGGTLIRPNGDINADWKRDLADAVQHLNWLFRAGEAPLPLCSCLLSPPCQPGACAPGAACIPFLGSSLCTSELTTCGEVRGLYEFLVLAEASCRPEVGCHVLAGHCAIGLGGCYHALPRTIRQDHLDALAARFLELGGLESCPSAICDCPPPPQGAACLGGDCRIVE